MLYFTGDINLTDNSFDVGYGVGSRIKNGFNPFSQIQKNEDDIWVGNFEGVVSDSTNRNGYIKDVFRIPSAALKTASGLIDYYGVANNHVMEHGIGAYDEMLHILQTETKGCFGSNKVPSICINHQRKKISLTAFSLRNDQLPDNPSYRCFPQIDDLKNELQSLSDCDFKVAYIHWGVEFIDHPYHDQRRIAHHLVDLGFDLIIGMHPHVLQGYEIYKGKYIFYSLGNFVFNMAYTPSRYGAVVNVNLETDEVGYKYIFIDNNFCPNIIEEALVPKQYRFDYLNTRIPNYDNIEKYLIEQKVGLKSYRKANNKSILQNAYRSDFGFVCNILTDFVKRRLHIK